MKSFIAQHPGDSRRPSGSSRELLIAAGRNAVVHDSERICVGKSFSRNACTGSPLHAIPQVDSYHAQDKYEYFARLNLNAVRRNYHFAEAGERNIDERAFTIDWNNNMQFITEENEVSHV